MLTENLKNLKFQGKYGLKNLKFHYLEPKKPKILAKYWLAPLPPTYHLFSPRGVLSIWVTLRRIKYTKVSITHFGLGWLLYASLRATTVRNIASKMSYFVSLLKVIGTPVTNGVVTRK